MRKLLIAASALAMALPALAVAQDQTPDQVRHDRAVIRQENRQNQNRAVRQENRAVRQDNRVIQRDNRVIQQDNRRINQQRSVMQNDRRVVNQANAARRWDRNDRNWWRGRQEFRDYGGWRAGFWYTPGRGYWRPDPRWYNYSWRVGGFVPGGYRSYYVEDPYVYGLGPAPFGFRWIYLGNNIVLLDMRSGRIAQVVYNVF